MATMTLTARPDSLRVVRVSERGGFWLWRTALYRVYQQGDDETDRIVLTGRFANHQQALKEARSLLAGD